MNNYICTFSLCEIINILITLLLGGLLSYVTSFWLSERFMFHQFKLSMLTYWCNELVYVDNGNIGFINSNGGDATTEIEQNQARNKAARQIETFFTILIYYNYKLYAEQFDILSKQFLETSSYENWYACTRMISDMKGHNIFHSAQTAFSEFTLDDPQINIHEKSTT